MREILLSTHLLFHDREDWEAALIETWVEEDEVLKTQLLEAAALAVRDTNRQTRVPPHLRTREDQRDEYQAHLDGLKEKLIRKNYPAFLANYSQVEIIGPREVLQETALLQQIVLYLEIKLASHAVETGNCSWRHALILLHYAPEAADRKKIEDVLRQQMDADTLSPVLISHFGLLADSGAPKSPADDRKSMVLEQAEERLHREQSLGGAAGKSPSLPDEGPLVAFDAEEAARIEAILTEMVNRQGEEPLLYNPEDYEHELLRHLRGDPMSSLFQLHERVPPSHVDDLMHHYQVCYGDVIDRTLQREVLTQHHAPELKELFEGEGRKRLEELVARLRSHLADEPEEVRRKTISAEVEQYLTERRFPAYAKSPLFYLDYYRSWIAPGLLETS
jgi:hypothetical protein